MFVKKGDTVLVLLGRDKGKKGTVERVLAKDNKVLVTGVNSHKKHLKGKGIIDVFAPLTASKVAVVCPKCGLPTRIGNRLQEDKKFRFCKKCGESVEK